MKPLEDDIVFPLYTVLGKIGEKPAKMVVDSGCTRTLVCEKFVGKKQETGEKMTVLTADGNRIIVPLAWVVIDSEQGKHKELVGVMENLPVDCLLGRSSYGQTLTQ